MNGKIASENKIKNLLQTALLIVCMSLLLSLISRLLFGEGMWVWVMLALVGLLITLPRFSPRWLLQIYRARRIRAQQAPRLLALVDELSRRAGLPCAPRLYWVAGTAANAFAVGSRSDSAIAVSDGLLRRLNLRELAGVIGHEVSHIRNNDLLLMTVADLFNRLTHMLSIIGLLMIIISLPLMLIGLFSISIWGLLLLVISPFISALLQMGLSRVREFDADLDAARLTGDPVGLASALKKIDQQSISLLQRILMPDYPGQPPSVLRSHPETSLRIKRLLALTLGPFNPAFTPANESFDGAGFLCSNKGGWRGQSTRGMRLL